MGESDIRQDMRSLKDDLREDMTALREDIQTILGGIGRIDERVKSVETSIVLHQSNITEHMVKVAKIETQARSTHSELKSFKKAVWGTFAGSLSLAVSYISNIFSSK